jgi:UDP-N-acetylglucosamine--N-acetylmuramyl-(pentapeptide) pyrophosphoryl-undecaprenol N-acetylglucosamine transferase
MIAQSHPISNGPLFAFAGGGTGGHIYPAIAVARAIREQVEEARFLFLGTKRPIDRRITETIHCEFVPQALSRLSLAPWRMVRAYLDFRRASASCSERFVGDRPVVVVGTGGMAAAPAVREAFRAGIPTALFNPDAIPGKANRHLTSKTRCVFAQFEQTVTHFPHEVEVTVCGCPVRPEFHTARREDGVISFGLDPTLKTLLITGASLGARTVNQAVVANAGYLAGCEGWQILHLTGQSDFEMVKAEYKKTAAKRVQVVAYTEDMALAMAAADLIVSRAGASTLAEIIAIGRASILMPYPFHRDQHQVANARCLADVGAAELVTDAIDTAINASTLRAALHEAMHGDEYRRHMAVKAQRMGAARRNAATEIAGKLLAMARMQSQTSPTARVALESLKAS